MLVHASVGARLGAVVGASVGIRLGMAVGCRVSKHLIVRVTNRSVWAAAASSALEVQTVTPLIFFFNQKLSSGGAELKDAAWT